jgi:hypothetical protein
MIFPSNKMVHEPEGVNDFMIFVQQPPVAILDLGM